MKPHRDRLLIVDDHPTNRKLLRAILEVEGFDTIEAADGKEALAVLDRENVRAVISDILMPRMDGYRLCLEMRRNEKHRAIPMLIYTSTYTSPGDEKCARDSGADKYIRKPAPTETLLNAVRELLSNGRPAGAGLVRASDELEVVKEYNEALVRKLEERNTHLERARQALRQANEVLDQRVRERTAELESANRELEAFSRSVAHDLRAPLRAIDGFARCLEEDCGGELSTEGRGFLGRITESSRRMSQFMDGLLNLAYIGFHETVMRPVNLSELANEIAGELLGSQPERPVEFVIAPHLTAHGDKVLLRAVLENLLGNAWKFTGKGGPARIQFGRRGDPGQPVYFVRDNGAGFDMAYADKLFRPFERLHSESEFTGSGVGLATVQRIIQRHGGRVWAKGAEGRGATFHFTLAGQPDEPHAVRKSKIKNRKSKIP